MSEGIDAVIVDSVLAIRKGLTEHQSNTVTPQRSPLVQPTPVALKDTLQIPILNQAEQKQDHLHVKPDAVI